jgi:hypothetical protein
VRFSSKTFVFFTAAILGYNNLFKEKTHWIKLTLWTLSVTNATEFKCRSVAINHARETHQIISTYSFQQHLFFFTTQQYVGSLITKTGTLLIQWSQ